jgi:hypothetical protein
MDRKARRASWVEQKDRIQAMLQQEASRESMNYDEKSSSESSEPSTVNGTADYYNIFTNRQLVE